MTAQEGRVTCEACLKQVPRSGAIVGARDQYFCGPDCHERWQGNRQDANDLRRAIDDGMQDLRTKKLR